MIDSISKLIVPCYAAIYYPGMPDAKVPKNVHLWKHQQKTCGKWRPIQKTWKVTGRTCLSHSQQTNMIFFSKLRVEPFIDSSRFPIGAGATLNARHSQMAINYVLLCVLCSSFDAEMPSNFNKTVTTLAPTLVSFAAKSQSLTIFVTTKTNADSFLNTNNNN